MGYAATDGEDIQRTENDSYSMVKKTVEGFNRHTNDADQMNLVTSERKAGS